VWQPPCLPFCQDGTVPLFTTHPYLLLTTKTGCIQDPAQMKQMVGLGNHPRDSPHTRPWALAPHRLGCMVGDDPELFVPVS
jgi:hypothetical protein